MFHSGKRRFLKKMLKYSFCGLACVYVLPLFIRDPKINFLSEHFYLMGTRGKIQIFVRDVSYGKLFIKKAVKRIKELELILTKFSPFSEVGVINREPFIYHEVSKELLYVLKVGQYISSLTNGVFDMGMGNLLSFAGIDRDVPMVGNCTTLYDMGSKLIEFDCSKVMLVRKNSMLDLGGIGKGFAIDEAMNIFLEAGINHVAIEFGGDIRVNGGMPSGDPWFIYFDKKLSFLLDYNMDFIKINTGSIAVSGGYLKKSMIKKNLDHHLIDPKSLNSKNNYFFVIVCGSKSIICDALSTAAFSMDFFILNNIRANFNSYLLRTYV